ncbi:MAG: hypothetical protein IIA44_13745 [Acidobacteria bacterium]|nr:hypothetical protein [Acidobacteriota bacterium]
MKPRIEYAKTEDGVSIRYWTLGEGAMTPLALRVPQDAREGTPVRVWRVLGE